MFAFLKNLFGQSRTPAAPAATPIAPANPMHPAPKPAAAKPAVVPKAAPVPVTTTTLIEPPPKPQPIRTEIVYSKETVDLPLKNLWGRLDEAVSQRSLYQPNGHDFLRLPLNLVQAHLAKGSMKIPLAQFRKFSPEGLFPTDSEKDATEISIPLDQLLPVLKPEHLPRRPGQRKVEVPDDVELVFGPRAAHKGNLRVLDTKPQAPAPLPHPKAQETKAPEPAPSASAAPAEAAPALNPEPAVTAPPQPTAAAATTAPVPEAEPPEREIIRAPKLDPGLATLRPNTPAAEEHLTIAFAEIFNGWTPENQKRLAALKPHTLELPLSAIKAALKKGKIQFPWKEFKLWIRLSADGSLPQVEESKVVDLPLPLIAPLFIAHEKKQPRKQIEVASDIPDVFVRGEVATERSPTLATAPEATLPKEPGELGEIFGQPEKKDWTLPEIGQRTSRLPGVAGAIIATNDGLLVGGSWPNGVGTEAVAAFVPQIYNRLSSYTSELKLGQPTDFTLLIENVPLRIFKSADSYFTVLGRAGENLPAKELTAIATRLAANLKEN